LLFTRFNDGTNEASPALTSLADSGAKLTPVVQDLLDKLPSFTDVLKVSAVAIGFLADHTDELTKLMPLVVAGYVAVKAAQLAAHVVQVPSLRRRSPRSSSTGSWSGVNRELIASRGGVIAATTLAAMSPPRRTQWQPPPAPRPRSVSASPP
jgi:hypothetical protein